MRTSKNNNQQYYKLNDLANIVSHNIFELSGAPLTPKDIESIKWVLDHYRNFISNIYVSDMIIFDINEGIEPQLVIFKENTKVKKLLFMVPNTNTLLRSIKGLLPMKIDIRETEKQSSYSEDIYIYITENNLIIVISDKNINILPYLKLRRDKRNMFTNTYENLDIITYHREI